MHDVIADWKCVKPEEEPCANKWGCSLIKEFEREARTDGIPAKELGRRKTDLVDDLNRFINLRKTRAGQLQSRQELLQNPAAEDEPVDQVPDIEGMSTHQVVATGKKEIFEIDNRLSRVEKVVEDTIQIGVQVGSVPRTS